MIMRQVKSGLPSGALAAWPFYSVGGFFKQTESSYVSLGPNAPLPLSSNADNVAQRVLTEAL
jgi:hypothetical protein